MVKFTHDHLNDKETQRFVLYAYTGMFAEGNHFVPNSIRKQISLGPAFKGGDKIAQQWNMVYRQVVPEIAPELFESTNLKNTRNGSNDEDEKDGCRKN